MNSRFSFEQQLSFDLFVKKPHCENIFFAIQNSCLTCIEKLSLLLPKNYPRFCMFAASHGKLVSLKFLRSLGFVWDNKSPESAFTNNHIDCYTYCFKNDCLISLEIMKKLNKADQYFVGGHIFQHYEPKILEQEFKPKDIAPPGKIIFESLNKLMVTEMD